MIKSNKNNKRKQKHKKKTQKNNKFNILHKYFTKEQLDVPYLTNPVCKFIPLFTPNFKKPLNIVSVVFFKMNNGGYKSFSKYTNGISILAHNLHKLNKNIRLQIFIDLSIYTDNIIMKQLQALPNTRIVVYYMPLFVRNNIYHLGTIGTIIRIFPMFNFKNNDTNFVSISDIDVTQAIIKRSLEIMLEFYLKYNITELQNISICARGRLDIFKKYNYIKTINGIKTFIPYILMDRISGCAKINADILLNFIRKAAVTNMRHGKYNIYNLTKTQMNDKCKENICFGIDEYFANIIMIPYVIKNNKKIAIRCTLNIMNLMYSPYKKNQAQLVKYINKVLETTKVKNKPLNEKKIYLSNLYYLKDGSVKTKDDITEDHINVVKNIYKLIKHLSESRDYTVFTKDALSIYLSPSMVGHGKINKTMTYSSDIDIDITKLHVNDILTSISIDLDKSAYANAREDDMKNFDLY